MSFASVPFVLSEVEARAASVPTPFALNEAARSPFVLREVEARAASVPTPFVLNEAARSPFMLSEVEARAASTPTPFAPSEVEGRHRSAGASTSLGTNGPGWAALTTPTP
ncbi:hypothetical protein PX554_04415 [Sphingomonas sp. H39-1-10]|uniref:hypothetical protein n=1 Tax=Sphingomonas pollutisoli TaxID=3030829 RepID=UPI0023B9C0E0|nr:hypothetical protein [Sphingomonas pollutisoli]MDF0487363.1 hypothetical protein [Sphingomonas pollutisoli]